MKKILSITMALLAALSLAMVVSCGGDDGGGGGTPAKDITISFDANYTGNSYTTDNITIKNGTAIGEDDFPTDPDRAGFDFLGWYPYDEGPYDNSDRVLEDTAITVPGDDTTLTLYARWYIQAATGGINPTNVELVNLENGTFAVYKLDLTGTAYSWKDVEKLTVNYKLPASECGDPANDVQQKQVRSVRLMGNYKATDFKAEGWQWADYDPAEDPDGENAPPDWADDPVNGYDDTNLYAEYDTYNAAYIYDDRGGGWGYSYTPYGFEAADEWFTATYPVAAPSPNSGFNAANKPAADAKGPFYFGVGISGVNSDYNVNPDKGIIQYIGDVSLISWDGEAIATAVALTGTEAGKKLWASYADPIIYSWRSGIKTGTDIAALNVSDIVYRTDPRPAPDESAGPPSDRPTGASKALASFTWINNATQKGWRTYDDAAEGDPANPPIITTADLQWAKYFEFDLLATPTSKFQLVWQGKTQPSGWTALEIWTATGSLEAALADYVTVTDIYDEGESEANGDEPIGVHVQFKMDILPGYATHLWAEDNVDGYLAFLVEYEGVDTLTNMKLVYYAADEFDD